MMYVLVKRPQGITSSVNLTSRSLDPFRCDLAEADNPWRTAEKRQVPLRWFRTDTQGEDFTGRG